MKFDYATVSKSNLTVKVFLSRLRRSFRFLDAPYKKFNVWISILYR